MDTTGQIVGKLLLWKKNKTLQDMVLLENNVVLYTFYCLLKGKTKTTCLSSGAL